jgi:outer membrane protein OmpA-like peptidoglycan-associated protein
MAVPPKKTVNVPPQNVYPIPPLMITGNSPVPPKQTPKVPDQPVYMIPSPTGGGQSQQTPIMPKPGVQSPQPTAIITHVDNNNLHPDVLLRQQTLHSGYRFEEIEPTIKNMQVDVYRGKDASRMLYQDTLPMDKRGFHLTVLGIREPAFVDTSEPVEHEELSSFTFYFGFASAEIKPQQNVLFDQIIDEHKKTGKRIIIVGETDEFGSEEYNTHLAVHRSTIIVDELKSRGVKDDEIELRVLVRCCRKNHPTKATLEETRDQRITWVHFE